MSYHHYLQGVIREHGDLLQRYKTSCNDLRSEKDARRSAQEREEELQRKYDGLQSSMVGRPTYPIVTENLTKSITGS